MVEEWEQNPDSKPGWIKMFSDGNSRHITARGRPYRGINTLILTVVGRRYCNSWLYKWKTLFAGTNQYAPVWMTYKHATEIGGQVRKGEKATMVVFWKRFDNLKPCSCSNPRRHTNGSHCELKRTFVLRYFSVFNLAQIDGDLALPKRVREALSPERKQNDPIADAQAVVDNMPNRPEILMDDDGRAYYIPSTDQVHMPNMNLFDASEAFYIALYHELSHATGSENRLRRHDKDHQFSPFGTEDYSKEELVAEISAAMLAGHVGISDNRLLTNSAAYVAHWASKIRNEPKVVIQAASQAQKACDYILNYSPESEEDDAESDD